MTTYRRRTLVLACGAALCLAGMVLLLTSPAEAAGSGGDYHPRKADWSQ